MVSQVYAGCPGCRPKTFLWSLSSKRRKRGEKEKKGKTKKKKRKASRTTENATSRKSLEEKSARERWFP